MSEGRDRRQSLQSLERGIAVIQVFSRERPALTLSEVARMTGITRATARRILLTLEEVGHVRSDGRLFSLTPRVLSLGWAYLSSLNLWETAQPLMEELSERTNESCSAATLDLPDVVYVARMPTRRIMTISLGVGSRLPAHCTSIGRVLLAGLPDDELDAFLAGGRARGLHRAHDHRSRAPARRDRHRPRRGLGAGRPGARDRPALDLGAAARRRRDDRRHQPRGRRPARAGRRAARRDAARAAPDGRADLGRAGALAPAGGVRGRRDGELRAMRTPSVRPRPKNAQVPGGVGRVPIAVQVFAERTGGDESYAQ